jgi:hypothetical protein
MPAKKTSKAKKAKKVAMPGGAMKRKNKNNKKSTRYG